MMGIRSLPSPFPEGHSEVTLEPSCRFIKGQRLRGRIYEIVAVVMVTVAQVDQPIGMRLLMRKSWQVRYPNFAPPFPFEMGF